MVLYQIYDSLLNYVACHENFTAVTMWGDEQNLSYPRRVVLMAITIKYNYSLVCISVKALACAGSSPRDPAGTVKWLQLFSVAAGSLARGPYVRMQVLQ